MPFFDEVALAPPDPIFGLTAAYLADDRPQKVSLSVGYYRDEQLRTPILGCVKKAEKVLLDSEPNKEYLPIEGHASLLERLGELIFGEVLWGKEKERIARFQAVGGTGALETMGTFLKEEVDCPLWIPAPTWPNHRGIFARCQLQLGEYLHGESFEKIKNGSAVLVHASCHNPTGIDLEKGQWEEFLDIVEKKQLLVIFDCAYQGLGKGIEEDAWAIRLFMERGIEMCVAYSAAKNFSLYGERVGALFIVGQNAAAAERIRSRVKQIIRTHYSNPPKHGAAIVSHILCDSALRKEWMGELEAMRRRMTGLRRELGERLARPHIQKGVGMFCMLGLDEKQVDRLRTECAIYMTRDGRINVCGLNQNNIDYVVDAILTLPR